MSERKLLSVFMLLVLLVLSRVFAEIAERLNQPGLVGELIAGIALRAGLFNAPSPPPPIVASLFSSVVIMAVATTIATPIAVNAVLKWGGARHLSMLEQHDEGA